MSASTFAQMGTTWASSRDDGLIVGALVVVLEARLVEVRREDDRLEGEQVGGVEDLAVLLAARIAPRGLAVVEPGEQALEDLGGVQEALVALARLGVLVDPPLDHLHVGHDQLEVDDVDVARRVAAALDVDDVRVVEAAHHVDDGVRLADVREELVPQALAAGRALDQTGDVHELDDRRGLLLRVVDLRQGIEPRVRHGDHAHVGVDGAEGVVRRLRARVRDRVEEGRFAHVGQTHDT